jgi:ABC-type sugar transport system ATPase subunit
VLAVDGRETRFTVDAAACRLKPSKVTIGIRPRAFMPTDDAAGDTLTAVAELVEPMGAETLVHVRGAAGQELRVVVPRDRRLRIGERVHLRCDPRQTHFFDESGRAVRS